jgi:DNA-binding CsgD family transcriptional regulator
MVDDASIARQQSLGCARGGKEGAMLTAFGLVCATTADFKLVVRDAIELLRRILPADSLGFFWSDPAGVMLDAYCDKPAFLSLETFLSHQLYIEEDPRNWPTFNENVLLGPVAGYLLPYQTEAFYESAMFAASYKTIGARYILDAVAHDGTKPLGAYLFMRSEAQGPFSTDDIELARTIAALTTLALQERAPALMDSTRLSDAGLIVIGADGACAFHNTEAYQSLWLLERGGNIPVVGGPDVGFDALAALYCPDYVNAARNGRIQRRVRCRWGDFEICSETGGSAATTIRFLQYRPFAFHIATKLLEWELPARRLTVCWLALIGLPRKEIAALAGIGLDTVGEHLDAVFKRLGVNSTVELLLLVAA